MGHLPVDWGTVGCHTCCRMLRPEVPKAILLFSSLRISQTFSSLPMNPLFTVKSRKKHCSARIGARYTHSKNFGGLGGLLQAIKTTSEGFFRGQVVFKKEFETTLATALERLFKITGPLKKIPFLFPSKAF